MIRLRTNLDHVVLPKYDFPFPPCIGSLILCRINGHPTLLETCSWKLVDGTWEIELHIPKTFWGSLRDWYKAYGVTI